jgi:hypothetical protein
MRLPRVRFTIRGMMVAVAIVGAALGWQLERHRRFERWKLERHRRLPRVRFTVRGTLVAVALIAVGLGWLCERRSRFARLAEYYRTIEYRDNTVTTAWHRIAWKVGHRRKYERAARYPWLPVAPDSPMPPEVENPPDY